MKKILFKRGKNTRIIVLMLVMIMMGITLLAPGAGIETNATSTPSDAEIGAEIELNAASAASVAIDATAFPDDVFRQWVKDNCDKDSDGQLSEDERLQCTHIVVEGLEIASLQGIEYFPNLKELHCESNNISSLDVSSNTALTKLHCDSNSLSSLDVSSNIALTELDCRGNNLTTLDVSDNTALTKLYCNNTNISSLDVSNNTALTYLECGRNTNISSLDVSKNTALTYLECGNTNISSLDVSKNTALTQLFCGNTNISSLDVSKNTALVVLDCYGNKISSLDVSKNTALRFLDCNNNDISSLDVSKNMALVALDCYGNKISSLDLSKNTNLSMLGGVGENTPQIVSVPMYKNGDRYYIDLSELPLDKERVSLTEDLETEGTTYNSTSGQISLSETKDVGDTVRYLYETNGLALGDTKMQVSLRISEVRDITEPTTEQPTTEEPTTEQSTTEEPTTAQPVTIVPAPTQTDTAKDAAPKTGDTTPLYPIIFLLLASFVGGVTLYFRRRHKL